MNSINFHKAVDFAEKLGRAATLKNEDGRVIHTLSDSSRMIFDDENEAYISIRTNVDYTVASKYPFTVTRMEYDSIKLIEIDVSVEELKRLIEESGENWDDFKDFVSATTAVATSSPAGYHKQYNINSDGKKEPAELQYDKVPTVSLGL